MEIVFQARFNFLLEKLVNNAEADLLMFDLLTKKPLYNIEIYIPIFRAHDLTLQIIILGNKVDLMVKSVIEQEYLERYLSRNNVNLYYEISANEDTNKNTDARFSDLANLVFY